MTDRVGQQLGNYRIVRLLGEGGFADVYLGEHIYLKTPAAIKVLHAQLNEINLQSFINEAKLVATLKHPEVVKRLDAAASTPVGNSPDAFRQVVADALANTRKVVREANLKFE